MRGAGTDSDVFLTIYGPLGDTGELGVPIVHRRSNVIK